MAPEPTHASRKPLKFAWIQTEKALYPLVKLCRWLGVTPSGFYAWRRRPESTHATDDRRLKALVRASFDESKQRYGSPRVHADLIEQQERVSRKRVVVAWVLGRIKAHARYSREVFLDWTAFATHYRGLFLWEALVSGASKRASHVDDATAGVLAFLDAIHDPRSCVTCDGAVYSLAGASLLRTGWTTDVDVLSTPCLVVQAKANPR